MALTVSQFVLLVTIATLFYNGGCLALRIETVPEPFNDKLDLQLNISCITDGPDQWAKKIQTLQVVKENKPIAVFRWSGLVKGPNSTPNIEAEGNIERNASRSFLKITINKPDKDDIGTYTCLMYFEDQDFHLREEKASTNVTVDNTDLSSIVNYFFEKVSKLEKILQDQGDELKQQDKALKKKVSDLEINFSNQQNYTKNLENIIVKQGKQLMDLNAKDSFSIAFSVSGTKELRFESGESLIFNHFILKIGNYYDLNTGVFTTPKRVFHLSVWVIKQDAIWIELKVNDKAKTSLIAKDEDLDDHSSVSAILSLKEGDRVWPYVKDGSTLLRVNEKLTVFDGYLLKLL